MDWFCSLNNIYQALLATLFTWSVTALGAAIVFFFKNVNKNVMDLSLGLSAGVMLASSFWSLLNPSIEMANELGLCAWVVATLGILLGGLLLFTSDKIYSKKSKNNTSKKKRCSLLIASITLHNIPEGMAVGVAFGSLIYNLNGVTLSAACMLALGIALQNFPEGTAVSLPLRREGLSRKKAFFIGQLSAVVEPIAGVIGAILVMKIRFLMPYLLAFSAGAMIYVVVEELIPESQSNENKSLMALFTLIGFSIMMILDVALG
ncbi:MAG: ZIP family metal transporter [Bacilli bacterium]